MLKWIGAIVVFFSCGFAGRMFAASLSSRVNCLQQLQRGFTALATEIGYSVTALPLALKQAARQCGGEMEQLFSRAGENFTAQQGFSAENIWQQTVKSVVCDSPLLREDQEALFDFGLGLGLSDKEDQLKKIELLLIRLRALEQEARNNKEKMGKVWQALGWGAGAALVLLFL